ncbi:hypothetical protein MMC27_004033 [Xylographa pallens]|nr:hypothetical protein [Xylographa pallens]
MLNSTYQLSFGVELEFIFVFHEKLLIGQLRIEDGRRPFTKTNGAPLDELTVLGHRASLQKDLPDEVREELRQGAPHYSFHHPYYPSWGLSAPRSQAASASRPFEGNRIEGVRMTRTEDGRMVRTYDLEPIRIAKEVLLSNGAYDMWTASEHPSRSTGLKIMVRSGEGQHKPVLKYIHWHVTSDYSLSGLSLDELGAYLEKYKVCSGRDDSGASPFSNGLAMNSITNSYRPVSDSASSRSQGDPVSGADILTALDNYLNIVEQDPIPHQSGATDTPTSSVDAQDGSATVKRKPGPITDEPLSKRTRLSASPQLGKKQTGLPDVNDWDSYGVELVSSVLRPVQEDFETITKFCDLLKGEHCHDHGATINDTCGLHVHLKPDGDCNDFDLNTVQHLAYIIATYERELDKLQPFHRRTYAPHGASYYDFQSNTQKFHDYDGILFEDFEDYQNLISKTRNMYDLQRLMGRGKGYVVNFSNLLRRDPATDGPRTIEFRQHEGVLRGEMVEWWVRFCIGLLQLANHAATQMDADGNPIRDFHQQCKIYPFQKSDEQLSVWDLFDLMGFPAEGRRYFQRRAAYFADYSRDRDPTASSHSSDYGYKGSQRYRTPDPPSHSDLTSLSPGGSRNLRASSLGRQIITRVDQYLHNTQPSQSVQRTQPSHKSELAAIIARHSAAESQKAADQVAADMQTVVDEVDADLQSAADQVVADAVATSLAADNNMATGTVGPGIGARGIVPHHPIPHPNSPGLFNPIPQTSTAQPPPLNPNPFLPTPEDTAPHIQAWIPINSVEGEKVLQGNNLPSLTGTRYEEHKHRSARSPQSSSKARVRHKTPRHSHPSKASNLGRPSRLRNVVNASSPSLPSRPCSPFAPSVLPSDTLTSIPRPFQEQPPPPPVTRTSAARTGIPLVTSGREDWPTTMGTRAGALIALMH